MKKSQDKTGCAEIAACDPDAIGPSDNHRRGNRVCFRSGPVDGAVPELQWPRTSQCPKSS